MIAISAFQQAQARRRQSFCPRADLSLSLKLVNDRTLVTYWKSPMKNRLRYSQVLAASTRWRARKAETIECYHGFGPNDMFSESFEGKWLDQWEIIEFKGGKDLG
jgi:hypothetical protein